MITNASVESFIKERMSNKLYNSMLRIDDYAFDEPIVGFSVASDPLYPFYKKHIDENFYRLPEEWLQNVYGYPFDPSEVSIVSWCLPQTQRTRDASRAVSDIPSMEWLMVRVHGEECNRALAKALETWFREQGIEAVAPMTSIEFSWGDSEKYTIISNWSERHTAYIAGLGTFGLDDALISKRGKAVRYGSCIVHTKLEPSKREYTVYNEYCMAKDGCRACIERCPAGALSEKGHDKLKCRAYTRDVVKKGALERYGYQGFIACGLCQTGVPCEFGIPCKIKKENDE